MKSFENRVKSEFENVLLRLGQEPKTTYQTALKEARAYARTLCTKVGFSHKDYEDIMELCVEMIDEWFPDISCRDGFRRF